jgi:thiamine-phosphate pyrophosphorylase
VRVVPPGAEVLKLYYISDRSLTPSLPPAVPMVEAVRAGVDMIQVREKDLAAREILKIVRGVRQEAGRKLVEVYINARFDLAVAAFADGVHLPAEGLSVAEVRRAAPAGMKIGVSTHSMEEARAAEDSGADFITFGPIFETPSKRRYGPPVGVEALRRVLATVRVPVFALGGLHAGNVERVMEMPVSGIGMISALALASDPARVVANFRAIAHRVRGGDK